MTIGPVPDAVIRARDVWVKYLIRYHHTEVTLREAFVKSIQVRVRDGLGRRRWRDGIWALENVNLTVSPGEIVGLIGRNGSGKTTLLKTLAGIIGTDRGSVTIRGKLGCLLSFGVGFNPGLTGRENIYLNGSMIGIPRSEIDQCLQEIIELSDLGEFIDAPVRTYSSGMRVRLGFAVALHVAPDVLLLDEVLTVGDAAFRSKTGSILERLCNDQRTIVIASHSIGLIQELCTRAVWLDRGEVRRDGCPDEVCKAYLDDVQAGGSLTAAGETAGRRAV